MYKKVILKEDLSISTLNGGSLAFHVFEYTGT
jgi:hypothetical protein